MPETMGLRQGRNLENYEFGQNFVRQLARADVEKEKQAQRTKVDDSVATLARMNRTKNSISERILLISKVREQIETKYNESPSDFSFSKGVFYMVLSLVLLFGDIAILSVVFAKVLHMSIEILLPTGVRVSFNNLFFNSPLEAYEYFPDLMMLTLSILFMGFFLKVIEDIFPHEKSQIWLKNIFLAMLVLSFTSVFMMAGARILEQPQTAVGLMASKLPTVTISTPVISPSSSGTPLLIRIGSAILGLALPYVSAGFFLMGSKKLGNRFRLWLKSLRESFWLTKLKLSEKSYASTDLNKIREQEKLKDLSSASWEEQVYQNKLNEYNRGYLSGVQELLGSPQETSLFSKLQPIAIRKSIDRRKKKDEDKKPE